MAVRDVEFVIIGGGVAAAKAAEGVRAAGGQGPAVVLTAEPELPYERPPPPACRSSTCSRPPWPGGSSAPAPTPPGTPTW